jgi:hypothetical protein
MLELIKEEEARERKESKTTDAIQKAQGVIDERPVVASKRIGFWEEALKKQKQEVENSKKMMMVGSKPPTVNKGAMQPTTTPTFTKPPSANPNHLTAKTPETTIPVKPT